METKFIIDLLYTRELLCLYMDYREIAWEFDSRVELPGKNTVVKRGLEKLLVHMGNARKLAQTDQETFHRELQYGVSSPGCEKRTSLGHTTVITTARVRT